MLCPYDDGQFQYYPYFAVGECFYSRMANYNVNLNVPSCYRVIGTGDAIIADDTVMADYHFTANAVRDVIFVIGNDYHVATDVVDGVTVNSYYHSGREEKGQEALNVAMDTLKDCNYRLGTYPYSRFNVVETQLVNLLADYFGADNEILKEYIEPQYLENIPK